MAPGIIIVVDEYAFYTAEGLNALHRAFERSLRFAFRCRRCDTKLNVNIDSDPLNEQQPLLLSNATFLGHLHRPQPINGPASKPCLPAAQLNLRIAARPIQFNGYRPDTEHRANEFRDDDRAPAAAAAAAAPPPPDPPQGQLLLVVEPAAVQQLQPPVPPSPPPLRAQQAADHQVSGDHQPTTLLSSSNNCAASSTPVWIITNSQLSS